MTFNLLPPGVSVPLVLLILTAAAYDVRCRRIPNWLTITGGCSGLAMNSFLYEGWRGFRLSMAGLAIGFASCFVLYSLRAMGAGNVKLMTAAGAMAGPQNWLGIFMTTAIVGGLAGLALVAFRGILSRKVRNMGFVLNEMKNRRASYHANEEPAVRSMKSLLVPNTAMIAMGTIVFLGFSIQFSR